MQGWVVNHQWAINVANWVYIWAHWPVIGLVAIWLLWKRPARFSLFRNAFFISGAIGIALFATFPVAPPRLIDIGVVDTVTEYSRSYRVLQPPAFTNQYAAMPSLHFGWDLLIGIALITQARWLPLRIFGATLPALMAIACIVTANHYISDAIAGAIIALTGLAVAYRLTQGHWRWWGDLRTRRGQPLPRSA
jgi:membrane-associated phospholipid phosphatase